MIPGINRPTHVNWEDVSIVSGEIEIVSVRVSHRLRREAPTLPQVPAADIAQEMRIGLALADFDPKHPNYIGMLWNIGYCAGLKLLFPSKFRADRQLGDDIPAAEERPPVVFSFSPGAGKNRRAALRSWADRFIDANFPDDDVLEAKIAAIESAWREASPEVRDLIIQRFFEKKSFRQLAELFGETENALQQRLSRFRRCAKRHYRNEA